MVLSCSTRAARSSPRAGILPGLLGRGEQGDGQPDRQLMALTCTNFPSSPRERPLISPNINCVEDKAYLDCNNIHEDFEFLEMHTGGFTKMLRCFISYVNSLLIHYPPAVQAGSSLTLRQAYLNCHSA